MKTDFDILVVGGGLTGLTTALACASKRFSVGLIDVNPLDAGLDADFDGRASALSASTFRMMQALDVADIIGADHINAIVDILITDGEAGAAPSPLSLHFDAAEISDDGITAPMGFMVENVRLRAGLVKAVQGEGRITVLPPAKVTAFETAPASGTVTCDDGTRYSAKLIAACDGRNSKLRRLAGIAAQETPYKQSAIVTTVSHELPSDGIAHELFLPSGPFAILPLTGNRAQIVWTDTHGAAKAAMALPDTMFLSELSRRFGDHWGALKLAAPRWSYPLSLVAVETPTADRLALVGDAAHAIHPIAGQGLNMGLRDAAALADVLDEARDVGLDIGAATSLDDYAQWRGFDNAGLIAATDVFNRLFSNRITPIRHARRLGLGLVDKLPVARQFFMREAAGETGELPSLLR